MEGTLRKRIAELERRSDEIDALLAKTENEKFAWSTLCDIRKRVTLCGQRCNVSINFWIFFNGQFEARISRAGRGRQFNPKECLLPGQNNE